MRNIFSLIAVFALAFFAFLVKPGSGATVLMEPEAISFAPADGAASLAFIESVFVPVEVTSTAEMTIATPDLKSAIYLAQNNGLGTFALDGAESSYITRPPDYGKSEYQYSISQAANQNTLGSVYTTEYNRGEVAVYYSSTLPYRA